MPNPFLFIVGCPRSGTTLLKRMVDAHRDIALVPEIRWLAPTFANREGLTADGFITPAFLDQLKRFGRFAALPIGAEELAGYRDRPVHYADFMSMLFNRFGDQHGSPLVGHKNAAPSTANDIATLHALWPGAKFIHLIRDGRDVCLSVLDWRIREKVTRLFPRWAESPAANIALWWEWQVRLCREAGLPLGSTLYKEIRYEFLVAHPEESCEQICEFIGVPYDGHMTRFYEDRDPNAKAKQAWVPATPGRRNWKSQMPPGNLAIFEAGVGELLDELGYVRGAESIGDAAFDLANEMRTEFPLRPLPRCFRQYAATAV